MRRAPLNKSTNITFHPGLVARNEREILIGQKGGTIWLTGLSASGKSTIATALEQVLLLNGHIAYRLDGDNIRQGLCQDLGFSPEDRDENIRRIGEVAKLFADCGVLVVTSFISPYRSGRDMVREMHQAGNLPFLEIHVDISVEDAERRDPKGLYKAARAGKIPEFTGISAPYEAPLNPALVIQSAEVTVEDAVKEIQAQNAENSN